MQGRAKARCKGGPAAFSRTVSAFIGIHSTSLPDGAGIRRTDAPRLNPKVFFSCTCWNTERLRLLTGSKAKFSVVLVSLFFKNYLSVEAYRARLPQEGR